MAEKESEYGKLMEAFVTHQEAFVEHKSEVKVLANDVKGIRKTMEQIGEALQKIAVLEEHKIETKKDIDDLFRRLRLTESETAVLKSSDKKNSDIIFKIVIALAIAGLGAFQMLGK